MIVKDGVKMTANKYAKEMILDQLDRVLEGYWIEGNTDIEDYDGILIPKTSTKTLHQLPKKRCWKLKK
jgi:hypothetical protein